MFPVFTGVIASSITSLSSVTWLGKTQCYLGSALMLFTAPRVNNLTNGVTLFRDPKRLEPFDNGYFTFDNKKYVSDFEGTVIDNFQCLLSSLVSFSSCSAMGGLTYIFSTSGTVLSSLVYTNEDKGDGSAIEDDTFFFGGSAFSTKEAGEIFDIKALTFFDQSFNTDGPTASSDPLSAYVTTTGVLSVGDFVFNRSVGDCASPISNATLYQANSPNNNAFFWVTNDKGRVIEKTETDIPVIEAPTIAPVFSVSPYGEYLVGFAWTPSDNMDAPGAGYRIEFDVEGSGWLLLSNRPPEDTSYDVDIGYIGSGTYTFRIIPFNDAGEGPPSNEVIQSLPVEE